MSAWCDWCKTKWKNKQAVRRHQGSCVFWKREKGRRVTEKQATLGASKTSHLGTESRKVHPEMPESPNIPDNLHSAASSKSSPPIFSSPPSSFNAKEEQVQTRTEKPTDPDTQFDPPDSRQPVLDAVAFISSHRRFLKSGFEQSLVLACEHRLAKGRRLSEDQQDALLEIEAVVRGLAGMESASRADDLEFERRGRHSAEKVEPGHPSATCDLCLAEERSRVRHNELFEAEIAEAVEIGRPHYEAHRNPECLKCRAFRKLTGE